jgi:hypothetical protein
MSTSPEVAHEVAVMPGLVPGIHALLLDVMKAWMAGTSPAMTIAKEPLVEVG